MSTKIMLKNVRLSFPALFQKATFNGQETKFEATFLLSKEDHAETIAKLQKAIQAEIKDKLKSKVPSDKLCLKDGDESSYDGYEGHYSLKASNKSRPVVINKDKTPLAEDDNIIYSGCYVNAQIELWAQNNAYGKRINANLIAVQFHKDGAAFGDGGTKADLSAFDVVDDEDDDADQF